MYKLKECTWQPDYINTRGLLPLTNCSVKDVIGSFSIPTLIISSRVYTELQFLLDKIDTEFSVFMLLNKVDTNYPVWYAYDWFMPKQDATGTTVNVDAKDCLEYYEYLMSIPYYKQHGLHKFLCHMHSHANMEAFWSATDTAQQTSRDDLGFMDSYRFYIVMNKKYEIQINFILYKPIMTKVTPQILMRVASDDLPDISKKREEQLKKIIETQILKPSITCNNYFKTKIPTQQYTAQLPESRWYLDDIDNKLFPEDLYEYIEQFILDYPSIEQFTNDVFGMDAYKVLQDIQSSTNNVTDIIPSLTVLVRDFYPDMFGSIPEDFLLKAITRIIELPYEELEQFDILDLLTKLTNTVNTTKQEQCKLQISSPFVNSNETKNHINKTKNTNSKPRSLR